MSIRSAIMPPPRLSRNGRTSPLCQSRYRGSRRNTGPGGQTRRNRRDRIHRKNSGCRRDRWLVAPFGISKVEGIDFFRASLVTQSVLALDRVLLVERFLAKHAWIRQQPLFPLVVERVDRGRVGVLESFRGFEVAWVQTHISSPPFTSNDP